MKCIIQFVIMSSAYVCKFYSFVSFVHSLYFVSLVENKTFEEFSGSLSSWFGHFQHFKQEDDTRDS